MKYSGFSIYVEWARAGIAADLHLLAQALVEQMEVRKFITKKVDCEWLLSTAALASYLPRSMNYQIVEEQRNMMHSLYEHRENVFLSFWEEFVHPILQDPDNRYWAGKWRGGHITKLR